jgi:hypothetical protein
MLTIKLIDPSHNETILPIQSATYNPPEQKPDGQGASVCYEIIEPSGKPFHASVFDGIVFVMNEAGKTISRWQLSELKERAPD